MESSKRYVCFTDLKGSTTRTKSEGNENSLPDIFEFLSIGKSFSALCNGQYHKDIGDSHMISFTSPEMAIQFSTYLLQMYSKKQCFQTPNLEIKISICEVVVHENDNDIFGNGVNLAARFNSKPDVNEILINESMKDSLVEIWGKNASSLFKLKEITKDFKGIDDPVELHLLDWQELVLRKQKYHLSSHIYDYLEQADVIPSNLKKSDLLKTSTIVWPVVPRDNVNAVHRGQLEMIRLLTFLGCTVHVIIADCGTGQTSSISHSKRFEEKIKEYMKKRDMSNFKFTKLSEFFTAGNKCPACHASHAYLQNIIESISVEDLNCFNMKKYSDSEEEKRLFRKKTLDYLKPAFIISAVLNAVEKNDAKSIVIAGYDEKEQWVRAHNICETQNKIGVLFNPIINKSDGKGQGRQTNDWLTFYSKKAILEAMEEFDIASWFLKMHIFLPNFPHLNVSLSSIVIDADNWDEIIKSDIDTTLKKEIADYTNEVIW